MIFDPNHGVRKTGTDTVEVGAKKELAQGKQIANKSNQIYASENEQLSLEAKDTLQALGRELFGYAGELQHLSLMLSALVAAIEVGAYKRIAMDLSPESSNKEAQGIETAALPPIKLLANFSNVLSSLLTECDSLRVEAQKYAERHLELDENEGGCGPGSASDMTHHYMMQNINRPIEQVESATRRFIEHFEEIIGRLGSRLDAVVGFLERIKAEEYNFILQLLRCEPSREWEALSPLITADQKAREQLLFASKALRSRIQDESRNSLIAPISTLREALLADARE